MPPFPDFTESGNMLPGIYKGSLEDVIARFGSGTPRRQQISGRLTRIYNLAKSTAQVARFIVFGSFVTNKTDSNDVDIFILMDDTFDVSQLSGEIAFIFDHPIAQNYFGASIFWVRRRRYRTGKLRGAATNVG